MQPGQPLQNGLHSRPHSPLKPRDSPPEEPAICLQDPEQVALDAAPSAKKAL